MDFKQKKTFWDLKGNPNYQGILSWIIQIFHYYCRKQYKNIKNSRIVEQNLILSLPFSLFTRACASCRLPQRFKRHKWSFMCPIYFRFLVENGFLQVKPARCHCLHKKTVYNNFNICYFMSSITTERLYKSFSFINSSAQI